MGDLSYYFNHKDFACRCNQCQGEYRIHLGLVGALELIAAHFNKPIKIREAFRCEEYNEKIEGHKKSPHLFGKAAHISIDGVPLKDLYNFALTVPEIKWIGYYPAQDFIHVDTDRRKEETRYEYLKDQGRYAPLTPERKKIYGLD